MNDTINRIRTIQDLCAVVEGELIESGHPLFAGKAAALYDLAASLERSLAHLNDGLSDTVTTSTAFWHPEHGWHTYVSPRVTFDGE